MRLLLDLLESFSDGTLEAWIAKVPEKGHARFELNKLFTWFKEKSDVQPNQQSTSSKTPTNPSQIVSKIKEKVLSLAQRSLADKNKMTVQESELTNYFSEYF